MSTMAARPSLQEAKKQVLHKIDELKDEALGLLQSMIRIPSPNPPGDERQIANFNADYMRRQGLVVRQIEPFENRISNARSPKGSNVGVSGSVMSPSIWRAGRDSNPRNACTFAGFQDRSNQPLCHLPVGWHLPAGPRQVQFREEAASCRSFRGLRGHDAHRRLARAETVG